MEVFGPNLSLLFASIFCIQHTHWSSAVHLALSLGLITKLVLGEAWIASVTIHWDLA
jgi:hypothetical protein